MLEIIIDSIAILMCPPVSKNKTVQGVINMNNDKWWCSRFWYIPIAVIIACGYFLGGFLLLKFGFPIEKTQVFNSDYLITLFSLGMIGGSLNCTVYFSNDVNCKEYKDDEEKCDKARFPTVFDVFLYFFQIICGGVTGIVFYLTFKAGLIAISTPTTGDVKVDLSPYAAWLIAISGGFASRAIKEIMHQFVKGFLKKEEKNRPKKTVSEAIYGEEAAISKNITIKNSS